MSHQQNNEVRKLLLIHCEEEEDTRLLLKCDDITHDEGKACLLAWI